MSLLQITEPGQTPKPHQAKLVVGIDLGTTNSLIAATRNGITNVLSDNNGHDILPSVMAINASGKTLFGYDAINTDNKFTKIFSIKRILGYDACQLAKQHLTQHYNWIDTGKIPAIKTAAGLINPIEVSAKILAILKQTAEENFSQHVDGAVITVPAYFDEGRRKATKDAAKLAGLKVLRLINEPTAAALAYGLDNAAKGNVVVYDLGGGTFDISVLELDDGVFKVKSTAGDILLGGDDFDQAIISWIIANFPNNNLSATDLRQQAKNAKEELTKYKKTDITIDKQSITLTRSKFNTLIKPLVKRTINCTKNALNDANLNPKDIDHVVMVGGSTRVKLVQNELKSFFKLDMLNDVDPDKVVAIGAAIAADNLSGNNKTSDNLLLDITPLSLGIEIAGELVEVIIPRNTPIPITKAQDFTTYKNGQTAMRIHVVQGERDNVNECRSLATFSLKEIPPMTAGAAVIRITFIMDADGFLTVLATEKTTGKQAEIEVTPSYGLSDDQVTEMLLSSMNHAKDDMYFRRLKEQQIEGERVLEAIRQAILEDKQLLSEKEANGIVNSIQQLEQCIKGTNAKAIKQAITNLENAADSFIEKRMNTAVMKIMQGQKIDTFK